MVQIGCLARYFNEYKAEVEFAKSNGFALMQIWYDRNGIALQKDALSKEKIIKEAGFPTIIHAVLDVNEFREHVPIVLDMLLYLGHKEVIIHPVCKSEPITKDTIYKLAEEVGFALRLFSQNGINLYLENNSKLDPVFNTPEEIKLMFDRNPGLEFLLDVAHIESYEHLKNIVSVKMPKVLHIADKHFDVIHEHLPIGVGELDYEYILRDALKGFNGKIILEIIQSDEAMIESKEKIARIFAKA